MVEYHRGRRPADLMAREKPMWFPGGVGTRAVLVGVLAGALVIGTGYTLRAHIDHEITASFAAALINVACMAIGYYFRDRVANGNGN